MGSEQQRGKPEPAHRFVEVPDVPQRLEESSVVYGRLLVAAVLAMVVTITATSIAVGLYFAGSQQTTDPARVSVGPFEPLVSQDVPPTTLILTAIAAIVAIGAVAVTFEVIAAMMSISPRRRILGTLRSGRPSAPVNGPVRVTILIPAHNEEPSLPGTLAALSAQTRQPDRVIVVADNCTDRTAQIAREAGHEAFETVANTHKKGGALNQVLTRILPATDARDLVMIMDADTQLGPQFLEVAAARLEQDPELSAVGGIFRGEPGCGLIGQFQRNEYARYALQIRARHGRVFVLTGTATMFRAEALLDVAAARGIFIPGNTGQVYDTAALTEDNELTLALKSLGATMTSPRECQVTTELMPTWKDLWNQRKRWQRGALENLSAYGLTRATARYWGQQIGIAYGTIALNLALLLLLITALSVDEWIWFPFWIAVTSVFLVERVATAWSGGWKARGLALLLLPELAYDLFLQSVFVKCLLDITLARRARWTHVQHAAPDGEP